MNRRDAIAFLGGTALAWPLGARAQQSALPEVGNLNANTNNVPAPRGGLEGRSNYFLAGECKPVTGLSVAIKITQDIVADFGFSFQLNAYSPPGANSKWQQYCVGLDTKGPVPQLVGSIDNWPAKGFDDLTGDLINHFVHLLTLPGSKPVLPAGYEITINLANDSNGNITGVTFIVTDNKGKVTKNPPIALTLVASLSRPGANITGATLFAYEMESKRLGLLHEAVPTAKTIAVLFNPANPTVASQVRSINHLRHYGPGKQL